MNSSTGRWVGGNDFFDRESELQILETRIRQHNHVLLTGQRRMGKTSIVRELGRRLAADGWIFLFADVEAATCPEDAIAEIAKAAFPVLPSKSRVFRAMDRWFNRSFEEVSAYGLRVKTRARLNPGSWRRYGERLLGDCAAQDRPVLLVVDELPIFLRRMETEDGSSARVDEFLSWLRGVVQSLGEDSPVLVASGSIGLQPLVNRLGMPDRINHLYTFRLGPWDRAASIRCFERLAENYGLFVEVGVASGVYEALGIGIPHHVQSFFARLHDFATMHGRNRVTQADAGRCIALGFSALQGKTISSTTSPGSRMDWETTTPTRWQWRSLPRPPLRGYSRQQQGQLSSARIPRFASRTLPVASQTLLKFSSTMVT